MVIKNGKTNWRYVFIVVILAMVVLGMNFFMQQGISKALASLETSIVNKNVIKQESKTISMPTEVNQNFLTQVNECLIPVAGVYGYTLRITSDFRSMDEQEQLYEQGRTEDGHIVSWATSGKSIHNYGYAVDVVDRWRGYNINWKRLARIAEFCKLAQVDDPHFEYRGGLITDQFNAGMKPAPISLPCDILSVRAKGNLALTTQDLLTCGAPNFWY
jgi:LAS superfamily LD-carboxypeptidase LdcB